MGNVINVNFTAGTDADALRDLLGRTVHFICGTLPQQEQDDLLAVLTASFSRLTSWGGVSVPVHSQLELSAGVTAADREQIDQAVRAVSVELAQAAVKRVLIHAAVVMQDCVTQSLWITVRHTPFPDSAEQPK